MRIVEKKVVPSLSPAAAFMAQRAKDGQSQTLRQAVANLITNGTAHTTTVAKVFELLVKTDTDRIGPNQVRNVLRGFDVENGW